MYKKILMILFLIILSHCSLNHPVSMWKVEEENTNSDITKLNFENETSFDEFKSNVIKYGELSDFPKLD